MKINLQKGFSPLIVIVIVIAVGAVAYFGFVKKSAEVTLSPSPTAIASSSKLPSPTAKDETLGWKTCVNEKYGYELKYPAGWKIWRTGAPEARQASCDENLEKLSFSTDIFNNNSVSLTVDVRNQERLKGTIWEGVKSLDEYLSKTSLSVSEHAKIDGELAISVEGGKRIISFHNNSLYDFYVTPNQSIINQMFVTFKFTK